MQTSFSLITELACYFFPNRPFATPDQPFVGALVVLRAFNPTSIPLSHEDERAECIRPYKAWSDLRFGATQSRLILNGRRTPVQSALSPYRSGVVLDFRSVYIERPVLASRSCPTAETTASDVYGLSYFVRRVLLSE
jgi:hypothetical protein